MTQLLLERLEQMDSNFCLRLSWSLPRSLCGIVLCSCSLWPMFPHIESFFGRAFAGERRKLVQTDSAPFGKLCIFLLKSENNWGWKDPQEVSRPMTYPSRVSCEVRPACSWPYWERTAKPLRMEMHYFSGKPVPPLSICTVIFFLVSSTNHSYFSLCHCL